jgi:hypothetical protein
MKVEVEIKSQEISQKTVHGKDGKVYVIREQHGWVNLGDEYPQKLKIPLEEGAGAYLPGQYLMSPKCLYVDRFGRLSLGRLNLVPAS